MKSINNNQAIATHETGAAYRDVYTILLNNNQ